MFCISPLNGWAKNEFGALVKQEAEILYYPNTGFELSGLSTL
jgi:hypothetical protein